MDLDGYSGNLISVQMLIITILKIEKLIIINRKMKSKTLFEKSITLMEELMAIESYMCILSVKDTISVV